MVLRGSYIMKKIISKIVSIYKEKKEVINYLFFGALTTFINLVVYFLLTSFWLDASVNIELGVANVISWVVAVIFAYVTNRRYVFESSNENKIKEVISFFMARVLTLIVDVLIMLIFVNVFGFNDKVMKIISQVIVIVSNYILSKVFVFKEER